MDRICEARVPQRNMEEYLAQARYRGKGLVLPQHTMTDFVESPSVLPYLRSKWEGWEGVRWGRGARGEEERETVGGIQNKKNLLNKNFK